jgi:hypothetical protein
VDSRLAFALLAVVAARSYGRTRNAAILVQTAYLGLAAAWLLVAPGGFLGIEDPRLYRFLGACVLLSLAWLLYLFLGRRLKWRGREILELAARPVKPAPDAFTGRPRPAGRAQYTRGEILSVSREDYRDYREELSTTRITLDLDLAPLAAGDSPSDLEKRIRERKNVGARFTEARGGNAISSVAVWTGDGRSREERKLTLTEAQGAFLYHLPFPGAEPLSVAAIMRKAGVGGASSDPRGAGARATAAPPRLSTARESMARATRAPRGS